MKTSTRFEEHGHAKVPVRVVPVRSAVTGSRPLLLILFIPHVSSSSTLQSVLPNSHFMCYEGGISVTAVLIAFQNDHCGDDLQIFSCHSVAHFKCLLARESIDQCFQGCGDQATGYKSASRMGMAVVG